MVNNKNMNGKDTMENAIWKIFISGICNIIIAAIVNSKVYFVFLLLVNLINAKEIRANNNGIIAR